jgi:hypothetical protein
MISIFKLPEHSECLPTACLPQKSKKNIEITRNMTITTHYICYNLVSFKTKDMDLPICKHAAVVTQEAIINHRLSSNPK